MGEISKKHTTSQLVYLLNEKKMKLFKSIILVCLFLIGIVNLQSCVENHKKITKSLIKFDRESQSYTYLDEPFTGIGFETRRGGERVRFHYYEEGLYIKREKGISRKRDNNIDIILEINYYDIDKVGDLKTETFYDNGNKRSRHVIIEILGKENNTLNFLKEETRYDKEGNEKYKETNKDYIFLK